MIRSMDHGYDDVGRDSSSIPDLEYVPFAGGHAKRLAHEVGTPKERGFLDDMHNRMPKYHQHGSVQL